jgi:hypothetical protein
VSVCCVACTEGSRQLILCLVRSCSTPMEHRSNCPRLLPAAITARMRNLCGGMASRLAGTRASTSVLQSPLAILPHETLLFFGVIRIAASFGASPFGTGVLHHAGATGSVCRSVDFRRCVGISSLSKRARRTGRNRAKRSNQAMQLTASKPDVTLSVSAVVSVCCVHAQGLAAADLVSR